jgi:sugar lactone lactonase YvrE
LTAAPTTIPFGGQTTLTATVTNSTFASPTGTVQFYVGGVAGRLLGTATLVVGRAPASTATLGVAGSALNPGANDLVAVFSGDGANDAASTSANVRVNVGLTPLALTPTTTTLTTTETSLLSFATSKATVKQYVILTGKVSSTTATGSIQFFAGVGGTTSVITVPIVSGGTVTTTVDAGSFALGPNLLKATYIPTGSVYSGSTSGTTAATVVNTISNFGSLNVGTAATPTKKYKVTFLAATTVGAISDTTQGNGALDYIDGGTVPTTKCTTGAYAANASCDVSLGFLPTLPGLRLGSAVIYDNSNVPTLTIPAIGTGLGSQLSFGFAAPTSIVSTTTPAFNGPSAVTVDASNNLFIADSLNNRIVEQPAVGTQRNVGTGFTYPIGMAVDGAGNLYVSDAAFGVSKIPNQRGTLSSANQTKLTITGGVGFPAELSFDTLGNLYIADSMNNRIVKLSRVNGDLDVAHPTYIGTGLTYPEGVAVDGAGNIFISDTGFPADAPNGLFGRIVEIPAANPSTQLTLGLQVNSPSYLGVDASGTLYIADTDDSLVLQVPPGAATQTPLNLTINAAQPQYWGGLALDMQGNLWAPDFLNNQIVKITQKAPSLNLGIIFFGVGVLGPQTLPVYNYGNANLDIYGFAPPQYFFQSGGTCLTGTLVAPGSSCIMSIINSTNGIFQYTTNGQFNIQDNEGNAPSTSPHLDTILVTGGSIF